MKCPNEGCKANKTIVQETRDGGMEVWRVRKCPKCKWLSTTKEIHLPGDIMIPRKLFRPRQEKQNEYRRNKRAQARLQRLTASAAISAGGPQQLGDHGGAGV